MAKEINFTGKTLDPASARAIVDDVLVQGARPITWWTRQANDLHGKFMDQVRISMENGEGIDKLRKRIAGGVIDGVEMPGIMRAAKHNAEALARTAVNKISNEARIQTFAANDDVVKGVKQVSTLDNRTSVICAAYDGQMWENTARKRPIPPSTLRFNGGPPRHFNCRSTLVPILKSWKELGIPAKELSPSTRASMDGQVPADQTFDAFLRKKGKTFQDQLLGPKRARLWRSNKISLQQMLDFTGNPLSPEKLAELAKAKRAQAAAAAVTPPPPPPAPKPAPIETPEVPDFKSNAEAEKWFAENMLRKENYGLGWIKTYDKRGLKIVAEVTMEMKRRFNMELPRYFGDPSKHPQFRFKTSKNAFASVHMPSDSLLTKTRGVNMKQNQEVFEQYTTNTRYLERRKNAVIGYKGEKHNSIEFFKARAAETKDEKLIAAVNKWAKTGNEFTAYDSTLTSWEDLVRKTFVHETGHRIHAQNLDEINKIFDDSMADAIASKQRNARKIWQRQTSEYATTNDKEWFAESFVHYIEGNDDRVYPPLLKWFKANDRGL